MMKNTVFFLTMGFVFLLIPKANAQTPGPDTYITVTDDLSDEQLVKDILINDPCAFVDNVYGLTGSDHGMASCDGIAYFTNLNPAFPIEEGIILSTDNATDSEGPIGGGFTCGNWPDDTQLTAYMHDALNNTDTYWNATSLEFEFTPLVDSLSFDFVFASNEYGPLYQCAYSDAFAFFLENADTGEIVNLALVPGTSDPISVVTIRDNQYHAGCASENKEYFDKYYGGCPGGGTACDALPPNTAPINYGGHTVLMTATGEVIPFQKYRMKLVIQNRGDSGVESAVFLEAGSFNIGQNEFLGPDITATSDRSACVGETIELSVSDLANAIGTENIEIVWTFNGEPIPGSEGQTTITATESGCYGVSLISPNFPDCGFEDEICIEFKVTPEIPEAFDGTLVFCGDVQQSLVATPDNLSELNVVSYAWYKDGIEITGETGSTLDVTEPGEYTVVVDEVDCPATATITLENVDFSVDLGDDIEICDQDSVTLSPLVTDEGSFPPMDMSQVQYSWSTGATTQSIDVTESGTYTVQTTYNGCTEEDTVEVVIRQLPEISLTEDFEKCMNEVSVVAVEVLNGDAGSFTYTWYRDGGLMADENQNTIEVTKEGTYSVEVYELGAPAGCITTDEVVVSYYENANCIIPQGISPNGDQYNQNLDLAFLNDRSGISNLEIFNRNGRLIYEKSGYVDEWEGQTSDGDELVTGTYFYVIKLNKTDEIFNKQVLTGWVYINRQVN